MNELCTMNINNPLYHQTIHDNSDNGWGFYVDIENINHDLMDDSHNSHQKCDVSYTKFPNYTYDTTDNIKKSSQLNAFIVRASSTTIITAAITYIVFFIL